MLVVAHNIASMNTQRQLGINTNNKAKTTEKLSSGFDINRAADNAAGLAISEKMRRLIRGLEQGTRNAEDGISWTQIGDGALNEAHDILQRMNELSIQALNETNSESDRMMLQQEFDNLQTELDRISLTTKFNELNIFNEHEATYYQCLGDIKWETNQVHVIDEGDNELVIKYRESKEAPQQTISITVPAGQYRTQELVDEIDSALQAAGAHSEGILFEYTADGYCNVNYEGGRYIDSVSGDLSYLLYDMYEGGTFGALIGTTAFESGYPLEIGSENNTLIFTIEDFEGNVTEKQVIIPDGRYFREEIIDILNDKLKDTTVKATAHGSGIKLGSDEAIVTKFKGNMFKIDTEGKMWSSVFYDNVGYGHVSMEAGKFTGGYVLTTDARDEEHSAYDITDANRELTLQPNGMDAPVTITLTKDRYTASEMASHLNDLFRDKGLDLTAKSIGKNGFEGLEISSGIKGLDSKVNIDTTSSAFDTLFVTRTYNTYGTRVQPTYETKADNLAYFEGSKDLSTLDTTPMTLTTGVNDAFAITLDGASYNIQMAQGTYNSIQNVVDEINNQLSGANALSGYKGKVEAVPGGNYILIRAKDGSGVNKVEVSAVNNNTGFDELFQGYNITYKPVKVEGTGSVTTTTPFEGVIRPQDNPFEVIVGNKKYTIILPEGIGLTADSIKVAVEAKIPGYDETLPNVFAPTSATGTTENRAFGPTSARGKESVTSWSGSAVGKTEENQGTTKPTVDEPAVLTIGPKLQDTMVVTDENNRITLNINGSEQVIELTETTYSKSSLVAELQNKINEKFGTGYGGATVSLNGNNLVLTAIKDAKHYGKETSISCKTATSSFLKELNTTRGVAEWTSDEILAADGIVIDEATEEFAFSYTEDGATENITVKLAHGTYNRAGLIAEINNRLREKGSDVTASVASGGFLGLTSAAKGNDVVISYGTGTGGSSSNVIFGDLNPKTTAKATVKLDTQDSIVIDGSSNTFSIRVNGVDETVTLANGTYTRDSFVAELNNKLVAANVGVRAYLDGNQIGYETVNAGADQSFSIIYDTAGTCMKSVYGESDYHYPGVTVEYDATTNLMKLVTEGDVKIEILSDGGSVFVKPEEIKTAIGTDTVEGFSSTVPSILDGVSLSGDVIIDKWNEHLEFTYRDAGVERIVSIDVPEGTYSYNAATGTYDTLQTALQQQLDIQAGAGEFTVTVDGNGVKIETVGVGSTYRITNPKGDFYDHVICKATERTSNQGQSVQDGTQTVTRAFIVGREDVVSNGVEIKQGISDHLTIDLVQNGVTHTLEMDLTPGKYTGTTIQTEIQKKLNEALVANGFEENFVEVGLGDIKTPVVGANDTKAINFRLSETVKAPEVGSYILEGVGGNAAFEVFYKTDGELIPAYVIGSRDVSSGVMIKEGENELHFVVDDVAYDITLNPAFYPADSLIDTLNEKLEEAGAPLVATLDKGRVKISHTKLGEHSIQEISGSARDEVFFREYGECEQDKGVNIQLSSEKNDKVEIPRTEVSTTLLGVNSICISQVKYATKAVNRISEAIDKVSDVRSILGSSQNKLEHAINSNKNKAENTTAAESRIRDADMAELMVEQAKQNILTQVGEAMLAQANSSNDGILGLLG